MSPLLQSLSPRRRWDTLVGRIEDRPALVLGSIVFLIVSAIAIVGLTTFGGSEPNITDSNRPPVEQEPDPIGPVEQGLVEYVNRAQGYGFSYPGTWNLREAERLTRVESPSGRIVVSFRLGASGDLEGALDRLLESLIGGQSDPELIGEGRERIDGRRSLLVSGRTTDEAGRTLRFLAITVRGEPRNFAISILVPDRSDPAKVLPRVEEIVTSFEILGSSAQTIL